MIGYKLFRVRKDGTLGSLFIDRRARYEVGRVYRAKRKRTAGFAYRPGFHICATPDAPHLSTKGRQWFRVWFGSYAAHARLAKQGGLWYTAMEMRILGAVQ